MNNETPHCFAKVLLAVDPKRSLSSVTSCGVALARAFRAELHVVYVLDAAVARGEDTDSLSRNAKEELHRAMSPEDVLALTIHWEVRFGETAAEIIKYAEQKAVDLIVMGARRRRTLSRLFYGSNTDEVQRHGPCPLLLVPVDTHVDTRDLLRRGATALRDEFGAAVLARNTLRSEFIQTLRRSMSVTESRAQDLLGQLESENVVVWPDVAVFNSMLAAQREASEQSSGEAVGGGEPADAAVPEDDMASPAANAVDGDADDDGVVSGGELDDTSQQSTSVTRVAIVPARLENTGRLDFSRLSSDGPEAPAHDLLRRAADLNATDIHVDPTGQGEFAVQFRIDGQMTPYCSLDEAVGEHLIQRFKTMANLHIVEPFQPQVGYLRLPLRNDHLQVRVTAAPVVGGEAVCLRVHQESQIFRPLETLGLSDQGLAAVREMTQRREGMVVVSGPSGAGKTTTIYALLQHIRARNSHALIASIEDPVEMSVPFIRQMSVNEARGMTYHKSLSSMLRLDPDVLFIGEIRDRDTAEVALRAATSGRQVFTTMHCRDVASAVDQLEDLGIPRRTLGAQLTGIINQRLVRCLCVNCRRPRPIAGNERQMFEQHGVETPEQLWDAPGCYACRMSGYRGRTGMFEMILADGSLRESLRRGDSIATRLDQSSESGHAMSVSAAALENVRRGVCSVQAVLDT